MNYMMNFSSDGLHFSQSPPQEANLSSSDKSNIIFTNWECRQKLGLNRKDKYAQNRRN